jgi:nitrogen regulatory protein PII
MKQICAIVRPFLAEKVLDNLRLAPLEALVVREVKGFGRQKSYVDEYADDEYGLAFLPKVEITMWVEDFRVEEVVGRINEASRTGRMGDGKVIVQPLDGFFSG